MYEVQLLMLINSWTCTQGLSVVWYFGVQTSSCCLTDVDCVRLQRWSAPDQLYRVLCHNLHVVCRLTEADITIIDCIYHTVKQRPPHFKAFTL